MAMTIGFLDTHGIPHPALRSCRSGFANGRLASSSIKAVNASWEGWKLVFNGV